MRDNQLNENKAKLESKLKRCLSLQLNYSQGPKSIINEQIKKEKQVGIKSTKDKYIINNLFTLLVENSVTMTE